MPTYDAYQYHQEHADSYFDQYPHSPSQAMFHQQPPMRMHPSISKKKAGDHPSQHPSFNAKKDSRGKPSAHHKGGYSHSPPSRLPFSHKPPSEEGESTGPSRPHLPTQDDEASLKPNAGNMYQAPNYIPLIEEEPEGYGELYPRDNGNGQQANIHSLPNIGLPLNADSPSNYKPFGTHFGPRIMNRYGTNVDYFTPQAKAMLGHPYAMLPGDSSSRSSPFKKAGQDSKTMPSLVGFAALAEQVANRTEQAADFDPEDS